MRRIHNGLAADENGQSVPCDEGRAGRKLAALHRGAQPPALPMRAHSALLLFGFAATALVPAAQVHPESDLVTHAGPSVAIGEGDAWAFLRTRPDGSPEALGVVLTEGALDGLPMTMAPPGQESLYMHTLALPDEARALGLPYDHVSFDWNPHGHEPEGLFTLPHFDVHFNMVPEALRKTWTADNEDFFRRALVPPEARYLPPGYVSPPDNLPIPYMGLHWVDGADPTYAPDGPGFTEVLIWGSYDGRVIFAEPMITRAYLLTKPDHVETLALPPVFERGGPLPTRYSIRYDAEAGQYVIALEGLTYGPSD